MPLVLNLYRRHSSKCPHKPKGRRYHRCACPVWVQGTIDRVPVRESLDTTDWEVARVRLQAMELGEGEPIPKLLTEACAEFLAQTEIAESTERKVKARLVRLQEYAEAKDLPCVEQWTLVVLDGYRAWRRERLGVLAWVKELQFLRQFFAFCLKRRWIATNPAKEMKPPRIAKARERIPYTSEEVAAILAACDHIGQSAYERLRARAAVLVARRYGLRVSDIATLRRDAVQGNCVRLRAMKNGEHIRLPLYAEVREALAALPLPEGAGPECPYFFWACRPDTKLKGHVTAFARCLTAAYRLSSVANAHTHRFRHTLASELLAAGATIDDVADILGDAPATIRKHYAHMIPARQERFAELLDRVHGRKTKGAGA
jgi:site-specific recombinase XerD